QGTLQAFFHGIVRWQWLAHRRKERATDDLESLLDSPDDNPTPDKIAISDERRVMLSGLIAQIGERCRQLLGLYQLHYSMREIGEQMGFVNEQVAANEVHDCRQKLKKMIQRDSEITDVLKTGS
ncbi:MAG TPA: sigma-70 family RNA polymerase sigma factor, partial [Saprospiraceae bacterium]|nr:sigma-70 family RNA polymerase sigma factor [Saprospiraceae bacterium]